MLTPAPGLLSSYSSPAVCSGQFVCFSPALLSYLSVCLSPLVLCPLAVHKFPTARKNAFSNLQMDTDELVNNERHKFWEAPGVIYICYIRVRFGVSSHHMGRPAGPWPPGWFFSVYVFACLPLMVIAISVTGPVSAVRLPAVCWHMRWCSLCSSLGAFQCLPGRCREALLLSCNHGVAVRYP